MRTNTKATKVVSAPGNGLAPLLVDLHVHSTCSDGTFTPKELVDYAIQKGLVAFALTDHDSIAGLDEILDYAKDKDIEVIPGIEFSTEYEGRDIHIVGLYIDYKNEAFASQLTEFVDSRTNRNIKMCTLLQGAGMDITYDKLIEEFPNSVITRAHYASFMLKHGYIKSIPEAFERYIGDHSPYYIPREKVSPAQAIELILSVGGIPVLAHPTLYKMGSERLEKLVATLKEAGLVAMETRYTTYTKGEQKKMQALAKKYNLLESGGTDFHGKNKPGNDLAIGYGSFRLPVEVLDALKAYRNS